VKKRANLCAKPFTAAIVFLYSGVMLVTPVIVVVNVQQLLEMRHLPQELRQLPITIGHSTLYFNINVLK
jgi:hypothetical protein